MADEPNEPAPTPRDPGPEPDRSAICTYASTCDCQGYASVGNPGQCYCSHYAYDHH
jgi:hypothetical protein